jgi:hypothetical protein
MKKFVMATSIAMLGIMFLVPSLGYCDNPWRHDNHPQYVAVRDHGPRDYRPVPVHYVNRHESVYVERRHNDDRGGQVAIAALGGIVVGTLLGTLIAQ